MTKFERSYYNEAEIRNAVVTTASLYPETDVEAMVKYHIAEEVWRNDKYQVAVRRDIVLPNWPKMIHLSIKLITKEPIHDWRDLQHIKNEIIGCENEAVELYPAESRLVDTANQYHLWVLADPEDRFPFGFNERLTTPISHGTAKQRPF
jgi:hypothetical protein